MNQKKIDALAELIYQHSPMSRDHSKHLAEVLEGEGYRKQSEGEWIWTENGPEDYEQYWLCSCCNNKLYWKAKFCEDCGAKMKGV